MARDLTQLELLGELQPVAEENLNRHLSMAKEWHPHDYVPWDEGRNFAALGGEDWSPEQSRLDEVAKAAMITNLLTEDNLPSYHREIAENFSQDGAWGTWVGRWTAEENRHGIVMRDYLVVTRGVDPVALEQARMEHMTNGFSSAAAGGHDQMGFLHSVSYVTFQELATRVSHRNTGRVCNDPIADRMLQRIAADENLHMIFYRNLCGAALDISPDQALRAIADIVQNFQMPGAGMPNFRRNGVLMAKHGIYDLRQHLEDVVMPVLRKWSIFDRTDFTAEGEQTREELAAFLEKLEKDVLKFEEQRDRMLSREAAKRQAAQAS
ncbi:acyl-ACP desaturase [Rhodococcus sp. BP-349]|uniref:acyl-ACP desaturase n=1 Tax=unclassified Rhodococcus (in: high G+C Gram-positive bacteria) TaxID=192944 RepID=UPI001C9AC250|nr:MULTISPECIES: acyl-ACP desaturase [unclassified Rhodococcus (in: high G+C Gram-positive bacteria)]MBY6538172.1 acyl-ACP desaturase [Rhodococcus sp. BP-363]MBY6542509.1 acyl-ACP desaturase [Rhodococcus sp. BP-369]MBY6561739.1 acyl-ACP desaturase [Rhodococcus sp. BP-370]MBY6576031.1 acyl-ACP desaturase [Rhodococcus sp. BP-364]MBY6585332.1 acyl-ACP desaturase [Rhodococcus sp. BP-358]